MKYEIINQLTIEQLEQLHSLYQLEWWTNGRLLVDVENMVKNSDVIIGFCENGKLIGFARVLTDFVYKALVLDVIVNDAYRNKGLGKALMDEITNHPSLRKVKHLELYCRPEMVEFYKKWGFTEDLPALHFMRAINNNF